MTNKLVSLIRNAVSSPLISHCGICGDSWAWKKEHTIIYIEGQGVEEGAFPVCDECWQTKPDEDILWATKGLIRKWLDQSPCDYFEESKHKGELLLEATKKALANRHILFQSRENQKEPQK